MTYDNIDAYLMGQSIPDEAREKLETTYQRSEHKRRLPVSPADTWWQ
jgi:NAD+ synthase